MDDDTQHEQIEESTDGGRFRARSTRRRFLGAGLVGGLLPVLSGCTNYIVGGLVQAGLVGLRSTQKVTSFSSKITLPGTVADYPKESITIIREGKFYLSHVPDGLLALYWKCTHLGCTVPWKPDETFNNITGVFHCPCHSSIYSRTGLNLAGPGPRPLDIMAIELSGNQIIVDTGNITKRTQYEPGQATKV